MPRPFLPKRCKQSGSICPGVSGLLRNPKALWALAGFLGLWLGFANDFVSLPPLVLLWPLALAALGLRAESAASALRQGWLVSLLGASAALYWLSLPVHDVGGLPWALAVPCAVFIAAGIALPGGVFALACRLGRGLAPWRLALALALFWYLLEYLAALVLGFPWLALAGALAAWPLLVQTADTLGAFGTGALWLWASLLALFALPCLAGLADAGDAVLYQGRIGLGRICLGRLGAAVGILLLILAYGLWRLEAMPLASQPAGPDSLEVLFVEGNVDQGQKWLPSMQAETVDLYCELTERGLADLRAEQGGEKSAGQPLVIWPETALPFFFQTHRLGQRVRALAQRLDVPLLFGAPGVGREPVGKRASSDKEIFNRAFLLGPDGRLISWYDKEHLVPFGEYLPSWLDWPFLEALLQGVGVYSQGASSEPLRYGNLALGMLICYEGIFPQLAQERVADGANILADISNDGWFGGTPAPRQHLNLTVLRALEQNRWLLRGTNTGISAVVDTRGRLVASGPQFRAGTLAARARLCETPSRYHLLAPWLPLATGLALCGLVFACRPHGAIQ